jgi:hypothetical protein
MLFASEPGQMTPRQIGRWLIAVFAALDFTPLDGGADRKEWLARRTVDRGGSMAGQLTAAASEDADFAEHLQTYRLFTGGVKYGVIAVAAILIALALLTL